MSLLMRILTSIILMSLKYSCLWVFKDPSIEAAEPATSPFAVVLLFGGPYMYWGLFFGFYFFKLYYV